MSDGLKGSFLAFCDSTKKSSVKASDKTIKKIFTDCKVFKNTGTDSGKMDIAFSSYKGKNGLKGSVELDYSQFCAFIKLFCETEVVKAKKITDAGKAEEEVKKLIADNSPKSHGTTAACSDGATKRLTDTNKYTGSHKERFGEDGKGKGIDGREDRSDNSGYVGNYKNAGTYDKKH